MCGLVSIIARRPSGFSQKSNEVFEQMLMFDSLRGKDSTGVVGVTGNGSAEILKVAELPYFLFRSPNWGKLMGRMFTSGRILAGHNRAATRGTINNENAHPFYEKNIVMMHNGTLASGWEDLAKGTKVEVDSHAICHALTEGPPEEVIPKIKGAFALMWYNLETEEFHAIRNNERPLNLITTDDFYFLASESWMATIPAMRNMIKIQDSHQLEPGELHTWKISGQLKEIKKIKLADYTGDDDVAGYAAWMKSRGYSADWDGDCMGERCAPMGPGQQKKTTQVVFPTSPKIRQVETEPRPGTCALTTTTESDSNGNTNGTSSPVGTSYNDLEARQSTITVLSEQYPRGSTILAKIIKIDQMPNGTWKWMGKISEPDQELTDCMGFLDRSVSATELPQWFEQYVTGQVSWVTSTTGGLSVVLREVKLCEQTLTHMGKMIPKYIWDQAYKNHKCRDCKSEVLPWEKEFTSVKLKGTFGHTMTGVPKNRIEMVCPQCIMKSLSNPIKDQYIKAYEQKRKAIVGTIEGSDSSVQDRESISPELVGKNGSTIVVPGTSSLQ